MSRWNHATALVLSSLLALTMAGCVQDPADPLDQSEPEIDPGNGYVRIWMDAPAGFPAHQIRELHAVPRLVAFVLGPTAANDSAPGFTDIAKGWDADNESYGKFDWTQTRLWYEGNVPPGNYSAIRIEVVDTTLVFHSGEEGETRIQGGRLSFAGTNDEPFVVEEGEVLDLRFQAAMEQSGPREFTVK